MFFFKLYFILPCRGLGGLTNCCPSVLDTVGWVIWPVKIVPDMTYNVFGGTLNPTLLLLLLLWPLHILAITTRKICHTCVLQTRLVTCTMSLLSLMTKEQYTQVVNTFSDTQPLSVSAATYYAVDAWIFSRSLYVYPVAYTVDLLKAWIWSFVCESEKKMFFAKKKK